MAETVTGLVLTFNGERLLDKCLESLAFCDKILVVDSQSTDRTREIAEKHGAAFVVRPWEGPVPQFLFALDMIDTDWVVSLDQDEWLTDTLRAGVEKAVRGGADAGLAGFWCPRSSWYFDRFLMHSGWYPDRLFRVFRNGKMEVSASGPHYSFKPLGPTGNLTGDIRHVPYENLAAHMDKINYYTQEAANDLRAKGRRGGLVSALAHGAARFAKIYLLRRGFLDGRAGLILAIHGFVYAFHKYLRAAEPEGFRD
ncbi:MAG: glycosyltransferase family 2 protein [Desulfovibrionaceae bacterium]